jgi:hypothetical protein
MTTSRDLEALCCFVTLERTSGARPRLSGERSIRFGYGSVAGRHRKEYWRSDHEEEKHLRAWAVWPFLDFALALAGRREILQRTSDVLSAVCGWTFVEVIHHGGYFFRALILS